MSAALIADKLHASLLQAAIQGKLTKQLAEDGDARDLLKAIEAEKARLIEEKIIKKEKPLPSITEDEIPFEIPGNWAWVRLGDIGRWGSGATPNRSNINYYKAGSYNWLKTGDLTDGYINEIPEKITELALKETSVKLLPAGSVLIAMYGATIGKLGILSVEATTNQACCGCIAYEGLFNKFLFYFLLFNRKNFISMGAGGAQPNISKEKIVNTTMPLPPLTEQHRIVEAIETALAKIDKLKADETKLDDIQKAFPNKLRASLLQSAIQGQLTEQLPEDGNARDLLKAIEAEKARLIEEKVIRKEKPLPPITEDEIPFEIPENWAWVRLGDIGRWGSGATPNRSNINYYKAGSYNWLKTGDLTDGYIDEIPEKITELALKETSVKLLPAGSVLIAMYGATIGKLGILSVEATTNQACCGCITYEGVFNRFLFYFLFFNRDNFISMGAGGAQPNISKEKIVNTTMPLPPLAEQERIVKRLDEILGKVDGLKKIAG